MTARVVVVNDCAAPGVFGGPMSIRTRDTAFGSRNFDLKFDSLAKGLPDRLTERQMDWLETVGHLYAVDLAVRRAGGDLAWSRSIEAWLPVRDPDYWQANAPLLQSILGAFTHDRFALQFAQEKNPNKAPRTSRTPFPAHDCVSLVSGGMDSFVGTSELIRNGRKPLVLSHIAGGVTSRAQESVEQFLKEAHPGLLRLTISARKFGSAFPEPEPSQRTRTFLFLAAACTVAAAAGSRSVFMNENGVMAIHLPMTLARIGSFSTHTAAPVILEKVASLASQVLEIPMVIENALLHRTKPDVVDIAMAQGYGSRLPSTVSCWSIGRTARHCGTCAPCLMRRISCEYHAVPDVAYDVDAFDDDVVLQEETTADNLVHLVRLIDDLNGKSDLQLQIDYPELLNGGQAMSLQQALQLHRTWAEQAASVLFAHSIPPRLRP